MEKLLIYISGPVSGNDNAQAQFKSAQIFLESKGFEVINPLELDHSEALKNEDELKQWQEHMRIDIRALMDANAIYMLKGWERSKGATIEHSLAYRLGMHMFNEEYPWCLDKIAK